MESYRSENPVIPDWEPNPWPMRKAKAKIQKSGFLERANQPISWKWVEYKAFPNNGIFGRNKKWFDEHEITHISETRDEYLVFIERMWAGWPDPPAFCLGSRMKNEEKWQTWGSFWPLPKLWVFEKRPTELPKHQDY